MYTGVPIRVPVTVSFSLGRVSRAMPKSSTRTPIATVALARDEDVVGFEIAMDHARDVRGLERLQGRERGSRPSGRERAFHARSMRAASGLAVEEIHDERR